ncbi:MAG: hypothetical protein ACOX52_12975 [Verrucomicrobiota bacterium]
MRCIGMASRRGRRGRGGVFDLAMGGQGQGLSLSILGADVGEIRLLQTEAVPGNSSDVSANPTYSYTPHHRVRERVPLRCVRVRFWVRQAKSRPKRSRRREIGVGIGIGIGIEWRRDGIGL